MRIRLLFTFTALFTLFSCDSGNKELKPIQQQQAGDYSVTILSENGVLKQGNGEFVLEFRKTSDNQLVDVGTVDVSTTMEMPGMGPMIAATTITRSDVAGRYNAKGEFSMVGLWKCRVSFGSGQSIRFNLNAQ
jgi:hypothetical protein